MPGKYLTFLIVPDHAGRIRRLRLTRRTVRWGLILLLVAAVVAGFMTAHYFRVVKQVAENYRLKQENIALTRDLSAMGTKLSRLDRTLSRVERFDAQLRSITHLSDPERGLAIGPVSPHDVGVSEAAPSASPEVPSRAIQGLSAPLYSSSIQVGQDDRQVKVALLLDQLDRLNAEAEGRERSLKELEEYFQDERALLFSTPSIWPAQGWVTSGFGMRTDPYTGERVMHHAIDIAAEHGKPVVAPAQGVVVYNDIQGNYGKVLVIDHGFHVQTRYGHLAEVMIELGEKIERGQQIGTVGNTGRSTGPHLHYEIRINSIPVNPRKYILD